MAEQPPLFELPDKPQDSDKLAALPERLRKMHQLFGSSQITWMSCAIKCPFFKVQVNKEGRRYYQCIKYNEIFHKGMDWKREWVACGLSDDPGRKPGEKPAQANELDI